MAKNKSQKCYLHSIFSDGFIAEGQYLAERICQQKSQVDQIYLPPRFWKEKKWAGLLRQQLKLAHSLLKEYPFVVILDALNDKRCNKLTSLGGMFMLGPVLKDKLEKHKGQKEKIHTTEKLPTDGKPRKPLGKKSILSQL